MYNYYYQVNKEYMNKQIEIPTKCPSCDYPLTFVNMQLFCKNTGCSARSSKQIEHFCKVLGIKGLGEKTVQKLNLTDITELYALTLDDLTEALSSAKVAEKLYNEINKSINSELYLLIAAFGIPLIGTTASKKLCTIISSIDDITYETCRAAGLGNIAASNLVEFINNELSEIREFLPFTFKSVNADIKRNDKNVCITGKLVSFDNKADANVALVNAGFNVVGSVTKSTDFLVDEEHKGSAKRLKADSLGIKIISDLSKFLKENI